MANKIRLGRATKARIETIKETLLNYELVYSMDTNELGVKNNDGTITYFGVVTELEWANILNKPTFATVATSGDYSDLSNKPNLFSGEYDDLDGKPDLDLKLDKNFSALPAQTNPLLTDVLVLNRGETVQKVTLGNLLSHVDTALANAITDIEAEISGVYRPAGNWNAATNTPAITSPMTEADVGKVFYVETVPSNLTWQYQGVSQSDLCNVEGLSRIGIACTEEGKTIDVSGSDIGMEGACHTLVCKAGTSTTNPGVERFGFLWHTGDKLAIIEGGVVTKWDNVDDVTSVNGKTGTVELTATDVGARPVGNVPWTEVSGKPSFATVATSGSYNNLSNKPTIPAGTVTNVSAGTQVNGLTLSVDTGSTTPVIKTSISNASNFRTAIGAGTSSFSGSYNDLSNKPTIPAAQVNVNWNSTSGVTQILNKPAWATVAEAKAGTSTNVFMSPARTFDAISVAIIDGGDL